jgi:hypothetical protein
MMSNKMKHINKTLTTHGIWMGIIVPMLKMVMQGKHNLTEQLQMVKNKTRK